MPPLRPRPVRALTRRLVFAAIVPGWVLALVMVWSAYQRERDNRLDAMLQTARAMVYQADRELGTSIAVLQTLATSTRIDEGDDRRFHERASEALRNSGGDNIVLFDTTLQGRVSVAHPFGTPLPKVRHDRFPTVLTSLQPAVSDLFIGEVSRQPQVAVAVPVVREGRAIARLEMVFKPARFQQIIERQGFDPGWTAGILDLTGHIVARNRDAARHIGQPVAPVVQEQLRRHNEGIFQGHTSDGIDTIACFTRSSTYGWSVVIGMPVKVLHAELARRLGLVFGAGLLLLLLGWWLASFMARRIAEPVQALVGPALAIGRGEPAMPAASELAEANDVAHALAQAQALLQQREDARLQAEAARVESESLLRLALDASEIGDWDMDLRTGEIKHSARHDRSFGHAEPLERWTLDDFWRQVHHDDHARVMAHMDETLRTRAPRWRQEFRVIWPDGSVHWLATSGMLVVENGEPARLLGMVIDITDRVEAEGLRVQRVQLEAENRQVVEASRVKSEFLANMSHELRTPLNAVIGFADILRSPLLPADSPKRDEYLGHIANGGRHLLELINDVLDLAKVEAGKLELTPLPLGLPGLVAEVTGMLQAEADRKRITVEVQLDPSLHDLVLDPARLKQVLYNFLSNAIKFTGSGGRVQLRAVAEDAAWWRLEVEDNGVGIAAADQARLFMPFQQVHSGLAKTHGGTGLGLALTRRLAELQGGSVGLRSELGVGSVFHVRLPRRAVAGATP
ncbi:MAG: PAS domain-containing protein [Rhizobacter sp.]|nr:PAS domain-containing protein [Rhizobacter sp.]